MNCPGGVGPVPPWGCSVCAKQNLVTIPAEDGPDMIDRIRFRVVEVRADGTRRHVASGLSLEGAEWTRRILLSLDATSNISIETHVPVQSESSVPIWPPIGVHVQPYTDSPRLECGAPMPRQISPP